MPHDHLPGDHARLLGERTESDRINAMPVTPRTKRVGKYERYTEKGEQKDEKRDIAGIIKRANAEGVPVESLELRERDDARTELLAKVRERLKYLATGKGPQKERKIVVCLNPGPRNDRAKGPHDYEEQFQIFDIETGSWKIIGKRPVSIRYGGQNTILEYVYDSLGPWEDVEERS